MQGGLRSVATRVRLRALVLVAASAALVGSNEGGAPPVYKNAHVPIDARAADLQRLGCWTGYRLERVE